MHLLSSLRPECAVIATICPQNMWKETHPVFFVFFNVVKTQGGTRQALNQDRIQFGPRAPACEPDEDKCSGQCHVLRRRGKNKGLFSTVRSVLICPSVPPVHNFPPHFWFLHLFFSPSVLLFQLVFGSHSNFSLLSSYLLYTHTCVRTRMHL